MEEALWGMDYVMKTRLGDGYRAQTWVPIYGLTVR